MPEFLEVICECDPSGYEAGLVFFRPYDMVAENKDEEIDLAEAESGEFLGPIDLRTVDILKPPLLCSYLSDFSEALPSP